jgi:small conductance mechanosensitive channel
LWAGDFVEKFDWSVLLWQLLKSGIVLVVALIIGMVIRRFVRRVAKRHGVDKKAQTLNSVIGNFFTYLLYFIAIVMILSIFGVNTSSILASAGIIGVAIGLGAQSLVKDIISGVFILFDNYFAVGDYVEAAGYEGFVEEIGIRSSKIRDWSGQLYVFPNGAINGVANYSKGDLVSVLDISVDNREDTNKVLAVLEKACQKMYDNYNNKLKDRPEIWGLEVLDEYKMTFRLSLSANVMDKGSLTREFRKICKTELDNAGIKMPQPRQWLYGEGMEAKAGE